MASIASVRPSAEQKLEHSLSLARSLACSVRPRVAAECLLSCLLAELDRYTHGRIADDVQMVSTAHDLCLSSLGKLDWPHNSLDPPKEVDRRCILPESQPARPPHSRSASVGSSRFPSSISSPLADTFLSILPSSSSLGVGFGRALVPVSPSPGPTHALTRHLLHATTSFDNMQLFPRWRNDDNDDTSNAQQDPISNVSHPELPNGSQRIKRGAGACLSLSAAQMSE